MALVAAADDIANYLQREGQPSKYDPWKNVGLGILLQDRATSELPGVAKKLLWIMDEAAAEAKQLAPAMTDV